MKHAKFFYRAACANASPCLPGNTLKSCEIQLTFNVAKKHSSGVLAFTLVVNTFVNFKSKTVLNDMR